MTELKPLNWKPTPGIGYSVARRADGGMQLTFTDLSDATQQHWHDFALEHLLDSDRLTRNLYDLREVQDIPEKAVRMAIEVNSDPSTRNLRVAVIVANDTVRDKVIEIASSVPGSGVAMRIFTSMGEAEAWLARPLDQIV